MCFVSKTSTNILSSHGARSQHGWGGGGTWGFNQAEVWCFHLILHFYWTNKLLKPLLQLLGCNHAKKMSEMYRSRRNKPLATAPQPKYPISVYPSAPPPHTHTLQTSFPNGSLYKSCSGGSVKPYRLNSTHSGLSTVQDHFLSWLSGSPEVPTAGRKCKMTLWWWGGEREETKRMRGEKENSRVRLSRTEGA